MSDPAAKRDQGSFFDAMRDQIQATPMPARRRARLSRRMQSAHRRARLGLLGGAGVVLAGMGVVVLLLLGASAGTPPAYALTRNGDGTITVTLNELSRGVPALNARFRQLGIDETVIPVRAGCRSPAGPSFPPGPLSLKPDAMSVVFSNSITFSPRGEHPPPHGFRYIIAAKRLSDGQIVEFVGAIKAPLPSCFAP